jgi:hypothetical protein
VVREKIVISMQYVSSTSFSITLLKSKFKTCLNCDSLKYCVGSTCVLLKVAVKELNIVEVAEDERCVGGDTAAAPLIHILCSKDILSQQTQN